MGLNLGALIFHRNNKKKEGALHTDTLFLSFPITQPSFPINPLVWLIGVIGTNMGIIKTSRVIKLMSATFASALKNSQPLSALMCLHLKILDTLTVLLRLHLNIANQELGSPAVCTKKSEKIQITLWLVELFFSKSDGFATGWFFVACAYVCWLKKYSSWQIFGVGQG